MHYQNELGVIFPAFANSFEDEMLVFEREHEGRDKRPPSSTPRYTALLTSLLVGGLMAGQTSTKRFDAIPVLDLYPAEEPEVDLDNLLHQLLSLKGRPQANLELPFATYHQVFLKAKALLLTQPTLLEIEGPVHIFGDVHGQCADLMQMLSICQNHQNTKFLFLGDYVDRGTHSLETIIFLLVLKLLHPDSVFLLRGNHETPSQNFKSGPTIGREIESRFGDRNHDIGKLLTDVFECLPLAAVVDKSILCLHGCVPPQLCSLDQIRKFPRPIKAMREHLASNLLWCDPNPLPGTGVRENTSRRTGYFIESNGLRPFLAANRLEKIIRAHEKQDRGFSIDGPVVTLFSAPYYTTENNDAAVLLVDKGVINAKTFQH